MASIRRTELPSAIGNSSLSRSPSPSTRIQLQAKLEVLYSPRLENAVDPAHARPSDYSTQGNDDPAIEDDIAYNFRLFGPYKPRQPQTATHTLESADGVGRSETQTDGKVDAVGTVRIRVNSRSPLPSDGTAGFVQSRPSNHYLASIPSPSALEQLRNSAITGETVTAWASRKWPGCTLPWRVRHLSSESDRTHSRTAVEQASNKSSRRVRLNKKRRVILRKKAQLAQESRRALERTKEEKEVAEMEKRKRLNRQKNIRRRAKEKAKKAEGAGSRFGVEQADV